jgi:predicted Zn-dependent protease
MDGIIYGEDPRQGYVENNVFYHPELLWQYPIPNNWRTVNSPSQVQMAPESGDALMILTLSSEQTLSNAKAKVIEDAKLNVISDRSTSVNGISAIEMTSLLPQQAQDGSTYNLKIMTYLLDYNNLIYIFHGLAIETDFNQYVENFGATMRGFRKLNDPSKINVKPERIKVVQVSSNTTLENVLRQNGIPNNRLEEIAILNSMDLSTNLEVGMLIKVVGE